jgi:ketosteroid isomerase-like protein
MTGLKLIWKNPNMIIKKIKLTSIIFLFPVFLFFSCSDPGNNKMQQAETYKPVSQELYDTIAHMDSVLFNAFNSRDIEKLKNLFTQDLEFYHDKGGLSGYEENMKNFKDNFAKNNKLNRKLVPGSLEVFPIKDYGAMEIGAHTFCHIENGKEDCGTFKFVHVWQKKDGEWKISRVVSYGH